MNRESYRGAVLMFALTGLQAATAATYREWTGSGTDWSTSSNWTSGGIAFAQLEWKGGGNATSNNNISPSQSAWRLYFTGSKEYTITGNPIELYDDTSTNSWVLSQSSAKQTLTADVKFKDLGARSAWITTESTGSFQLSNVAIEGAVTELRLASTQTAGAITIGGVLSGSGKPIVIGQDQTGASQSNTVVQLSGNNTYTGATTVNAGTLVASHSNAFGTTAGGVSVASGARVQLQGGIAIGSEALSLNGSGISGSGALQNVSGDNSWAGNLSLAGSSRIVSDSGTLTIGGGIDFGGASSRSLDFMGSGNTTISGNLTNVVDGSQKLIKSGSGVLTLTGSNAGKLMFELGGGVLSISSAANLGASTGVSSYPDKMNFTGSSTLRATETMTLGNTGASDNFGFRIANGATATFDVSSAKTLTIDGQIIPVSGTGNLSKTGGGTLVLNQTNTYTGTTQVTQGTLTVNGSTHSSSTVTVDSGAKLSGSGTIGGATTINGTHAPGDGVGQQKFNSSLNYGGTSIFEWDVTSTIADSITATSVNITSGSVFKILGTDFTSSFWDVAKTWTVYAGATTGGVFSLFGNDGGLFTQRRTISGQGYFDLVQSGGGVSVNWTAVPEPSGMLAGLLVAAGLFKRRR